MSNLDDDRAVDQAIEAALRRIPVPDHAPGFWERLGAGLLPGPGTNGHAELTPYRQTAPEAGEASAGGADAGGTGGADAGEADADDRTGRTVRRGPYERVVVDPAGSRGARSGWPARRRSIRWRLAAAAAVAAMAVATAFVVAAVRAPEDGGVVTRPADDGLGERDPRPGTGATTSTTDLTSTTSTTLSLRPGSEDAVLGFLDALGGGDFAGAANRLGMASEAYLTATSGSVEDHLRQVTEGYGAWAAASDRTTSTVALSPGEVVVVVSGTVSREGTVEELVHAFPARYAESAGAWFVEPWAHDPAESQSELVLNTPDPDTGGRPPVFDRIDEVAATAPGRGTAWLAIDGQQPLATTVGADGEATWSLDDPLPPGRHTLTVAFIDDMTFLATSSSYVVDS